jgi:hypothetical protein
VHRGGRHVLARRVGIAVGSYFTPMIAAVVGWITGNRGLAVSLVSVGVGVAPMTMSGSGTWARCSVPQS